MEPTTKPSARLSAQQWWQIIKQQHESGLSQKAFCQSRNIGLSTVFQTLIASCCLAGIDPCTYMVDVLQHITLP